MFPQEFEKDDDSNGHIDFITSASVGYFYCLPLIPSMIVAVTNFQFYSLNIEDFAFICSHCRTFVQLCTV